MDLTDASGKVLQKGWLGKPKGVRQILFESGWYKKGMIGTITVINKQTGLDAQNRGVDLCGLTTLRARPDFKNEMSELEKIVTDRGHILVMSPKWCPLARVDLYDV